MARLKFLPKSVLRGRRPPTPATVYPVKPAETEPAKEARPPVPDPAKYSLHSQKLYSRFKERVSAGQPHFMLGGREIHFPYAPITLLTPSARMTPFQAQFQVPLNFNKLDLRDYLWHLYNLRALNITTQIKWSRWAHSSTGRRYRTPQLKKMIIDMEAPFIWPEPTQEMEQAHQRKAEIEQSKYTDDMQRRQGSDMNKPSRAFSGLLGPYPEAPKPYVPKKLRSQMANEAARQKSAERAKADDSLIRQFWKG